MPDGGIHSPDDRWAGPESRVSVDRWGAWLRTIEKETRVSSTIPSRNLPKATTLALLAGVLTLASLGSSPALGSEPATGAAAEAPVAPVDVPAIDPARRGALPAATSCGTISFSACCFRTVPAECAHLCAYDKFHTTCTSGVQMCKAKNLTPGPRSTSHPNFSNITSSGTVGWSMACTSVN